MKRMKFLLVVLSSFLCSLALYGQSWSDDIKEAFRTDDAELFAKQLTALDIDVDSCLDFRSSSTNLLTLALRSDAMNIVQHIISVGADLDASCDDKTPLMYAAKYGKLEAAKALIENGVDARLENKKQNALDYAVKYKQSALEEYFKGLEVFNTYRLSGIDGPYVFGKKVFTITAENELETRNLKAGETLTVKVNNQDRDQFPLVLQDKIKPSEGIYPMPDKLIALSDIEGNFNAMYSFLLNNGVIDKAYNWTFGQGHLVLNGDFVDRGEHVTPVLWLLYSLEAKAEEAGGKVHFILGNHEIMNVQGDIRYVLEKYLGVAQQIDKEIPIAAAYRYLFSREAELGKWFRSKNVMEKIGDYLFVHAGLSPEILEHKLTIKKINQISRKHIDTDLSVKPGENAAANFLMGSKSPIWYRGLLMPYSDLYEKIKSAELDQVLQAFGAKKSSDWAYRGIRCLH